MAEITSPDWMKKTMRRLIKGHYSDEEYNRDMNVLFVKLHLLDPQSVIPAYQYLLSCRGQWFVRQPINHSIDLSTKLVHHKSSLWARSQSSRPIDECNRSVDELSGFSDNQSTNKSIINPTRE